MSSRKKPDLAVRIRKSLTSYPTAVTKRFVSIFREDVERFSGGVSEACHALARYIDAEVQMEAARKGVSFSQAYFLYAVHGAMLSTRLFLSGYLVPAGNEARQTVEALATAVLLPFPDTGLLRDLQEGREVTHKSLERLVRNAQKLGIAKSSAVTLKKQAQWFDVYSHSSQGALAASGVLDLSDHWRLKGVFDANHMDKYTKEMTNRNSMTRLLRTTTVGVNRMLVSNGTLA